MQQNAFDKVDEATDEERQVYIFKLIGDTLKSEFNFADKSAALLFFQKLKQLFKGLNSAEFSSGEFGKIEEEIDLFVQSHKKDRE